LSNSNRLRPHVYVPPRPPVFPCHTPPPPATYTLSLHDALPIYAFEVALHHRRPGAEDDGRHRQPEQRRKHDLHLVRKNHAYAAADRKSTRLNSSHQIISYAVFCLKKKN